MAGHRPHYRPPNSLLELPLELLLRISEYLTFADLWYLATSSRRCRATAHQIIWHRYHVDLSKPQLNAFNHIVHAALAYVSRYGYKKSNSNKIDHTILQSVSNRLAVEIYDRSPLKNWEPCLDFFLDKTLGIILDHVFLDPLLDIVPKHSSFTDLCLLRKSFTATEQSQQVANEFYPTRMGKLMTSFLTTLYPTMIALFELEPTIEIHHRLLLNHINRHLDNLSSRYHNHHRRRIILLSAAAASSTSAQQSPTTRQRSNSALLAVEQHNQYLRLNFRILIRFIGTLVQTDLLSANDLDIITRQRIQFFFLTFQQVVTSADDDDIESQQQHSRKKRRTAIKHQQIQELEQQQQTTATAIKFYDSFKNHACWQLWLEEIEFQMEIFLDLTRAVLLLQQQQQQQQQQGQQQANNNKSAAMTTSATAADENDLNTVSTMLGNTVSALISTRSNNSTHHQQVPDMTTTTTTTTTVPTPSTSATTAAATATATTTIV